MLLGTDGLLAGGPVEGKKAVIELVEQMLEQISDAVDTGDLPAEASSYGAVKRYAVAVAKEKNERRNS